MAQRLSAALLLYRRIDGRIEVLLGHMGGPFWQHKDEGAWSIPKGEYGDSEDPLAVAKREFTEELGYEPPTSEAMHLGDQKQASGKLITAWAIEGNLDSSQCRSNTFEMEWPKGSGKIQSFPEIDRAQWFDLEAARLKVVKGQVPFIDRLELAILRTVSPGPQH